MTIDKNKIRKEVHLFQPVIDQLQAQADEQGRTLKNWMEYLLIQASKLEQGSKK